MNRSIVLSAVLAALLAIVGLLLLLWVNNSGNFDVYLTLTDGALVLFTLSGSIILIQLIIESAERGDRAERAGFPLRRLKKDMRRLQDEVVRSLVKYYQDEDFIHSVLNSEEKPHEDTLDDLRSRIDPAHGFRLGESARIRRELDKFRTSLAESVREASPNLDLSQERLLRAAEGNLEFALATLCDSTGGVWEAEARAQPEDPAGPIVYALVQCYWQASAVFGVLARLPATSVEPP
jgi:hypothetical protein